MMKLLIFVNLRKLSLGSFHSAILMTMEIESLCKLVSTWSLTKLPLITTIYGRWYKI
jgi:hypothetical protein